MAATIILALTTIEEVMRKGDEIIKNMNEYSSKEEVIPYHCNIAPSMGKKLSQSFKQMDDKLKIIIGTTNAYISQLIKNSKGVNNVKWDEVIATMTNNPSLEETGDEINRSDKIIKDDVNYFKFDGSPDRSIVEEVNSWFVRLVKDDDVLNDLRLDIDTLAKIVAWTGATIKNIETLFYKHEIHEKKVLEIGVLRYPDIEHPYFKLYKVVLSAWSDCRRYGPVQLDKNGITGNFTSRKFKPRDSVIEGLSKEVKQKAISEVEAMILGL